MQVRDGATGEYYDQRAFFLGNTLRVFAHAFVIVQIDDFSLRYMQVQSPPQHTHEHSTNPLSATTAGARDTRRSTPTSSLSRTSSA
jgi:hypothetical protein